VAISTILKGLREPNSGKLEIGRWRKEIGARLIGPINFLLFVVIGVYVLFGAGILGGILLLLWYEPWELLQFIMVIMAFVVVGELLQKLIYFVEHFPSVETWPNWLRWLACLPGAVILLISLGFAAAFRPRPFFYACPWLVWIVIGSHTWRTLHFRMRYGVYCFRRSDCASFSVCGRYFAQFNRAMGGRRDVRDVGYGTASIRIYPYRCPSWRSWSRRRLGNGL